MPVVESTSSEPSAKLECAGSVKVDAESCLYHVSTLCMPRCSLDWNNGEAVLTRSSGKDFEAEAVVARLADSDKDRVGSWNHDAAGLGTLFEVPEQNKLFFSDDRACFAQLQACVEENLGVQSTSFQSETITRAQDAKSHVSSNTIASIKGVFTLQDKVNLVTSKEEDLTQIGSQFSSMNSNKSRPSRNEDLAHVGAHFDTADDNKYSYPRNEDPMQLGDVFDSAEDDQLSIPPDACAEKLEDLEEEEEEKDKTEV